MTLNKALGLSVYIISIVFLISQEKSGTPFAIASKNKPQVTIVLPSSPTRSEVFAAAELQLHLEKITDSKIPVSYENQTILGNKIYLGNTKPLNEIISKTKPFAPQEYLITKINDGIVLAGKDSSQKSGATFNGDPHWVEGKSGGAMKFNGKNQVFEISVEEFNDREGTFEMWVLVEPDSKGTLLRVDGNPWSYHIISIENQTIQYSNFDGSKNSKISSGKIEPGWNYVKVTYDSPSKESSLTINDQAPVKGDYRMTSCRGHKIYIGGTLFGTKNGEVVNPLLGTIDQIRYSNKVRLESTSSSPMTIDENTQFFISFDEGKGLPGILPVKINLDKTPDLFEEQGTCYAVYDFLELFCGIRWYGPTDLGLVFKKNPNLEVSIQPIRRIPSMGYRYILYPPYPTPDFPMNMTLWNNPNKKEMTLYWHRMRNGGHQYKANHSFYGYYDRFWEKNDKNPTVFESKRPEWFAYGYKGKPAQMRFIEESLVQQVTQDARDYFDGKGLKYGGMAQGNYFAIIPNDSSEQCKSPEVQKLLDKNAQGTRDCNGRASNYVFGFVNRVAKELKKTHPDKYIAALAYYDYSVYPTDQRLESNIAIQLCLAVNNYWCPIMKKSYTDMYQSWVSKEKDRPIYLWLYPQFPEETGNMKGFKVFPGFNSRLIAEQMKQFAKDGIRGLFLNGSSQQLNNYMYNRMAWNANEDPEKILSEFFSNYYGPAEIPMKNLFMEIESTYQDSKNYPKDVLEAVDSQHQTERIAWHYLGTTERMSRWETQITEAKKLAQTSPYKERVALFETGVWNHMKEGKKAFQIKAKYEDEVNALSKLPPSSYNIPLIQFKEDWKSAENPLWDKALTSSINRSILGFPSERKFEIKVAHDKNYLYLKLDEDTTGVKVASLPGIFWGDTLEIFFAKNRSQPYIQFAFNATGQSNLIRKGEIAAPKTSPEFNSYEKEKRWISMVRIPLNAVLDSPVSKQNKSIYLNIVRGTSGGTDPLSWQPLFQPGFHAPNRFAELILEQ